METRYLNINIFMVLIMLKITLFFGTINDMAKVEDLKFIYSPNDNKKQVILVLILDKVFSRNIRESGVIIIEQLKN